MMRKLFLLPFFCLLCLRLVGSELYVGTATVDITPPLPVALMGQFNLRIAKEAQTPISASVLALENRNGGKTEEFSIMVSCDLVYISAGIRDRVRAKVKKQLPGLDVSKVVLSATHTHTAPVLEDETDDYSFLYAVPKEGVTSPAQYKEFFSDRVADAVVKAWKSRAQGSVTWGLERAAVAYNRRAHYSSGKTVMYGNTNQPDFINLEGYEDHDINTLFFWDKNKKLIGLAINVPCPAQEVEHRSFVNADFWHPTRTALRKKYGANLCILGWTGAAGDQSPHPMYRKKAEERMRTLGKYDRMEDIAGRINRAVDRTHEVIRSQATSDVKLVHLANKIQLPMRIITDAEYEESKLVVKECAEAIAKDPKKTDDLNAKMTWFNDVVKRYERQKTNPNPLYETEVHVIRIGDAVICTNQFELFTDFGIRIQARSKALQTFVVQLAGPGSYLATDKAVKGGGYSAVCQSNIVSPEGGQVLVEKTLEFIDQAWK